MVSPHPRSQLHTPPRQVPWPLQCAGHVSISHAAPLHPCVQTHWPLTQRPRPRSAPQPRDAPAGKCPGQVSISQAGGSQPMSHLQIPMWQVACPVQSMCSQASTEQSSEAQPRSQRHLPLTRLPRPEQIILASKLSTKASAGGSVRGAEGQLKSARRFSISGTSDRPAETALHRENSRRNSPDFSLGKLLGFQLDCQFRRAECVTWPLAISRNAQNASSAVACTVHRRPSVII